MAEKMPFRVHVSTTFDTYCSRKVNTHLFCKLENITKDSYEVQSCSLGCNLLNYKTLTRVLVYKQECIQSNQQLLSWTQGGTILSLRW